MAEPISLQVEPLKYLNRLPEFNGDYRDLHVFLNLVDRVHPILSAYDEPSQYLFSDIIKSKLKGKAREIIEINCQAQSWADIKEILTNNFGEKLSLEELYDELRSTTFGSNSVEFYNEIKQRLRKLNNKTVTLLGHGTASNECARNNARTALNLFKEKMPEPMRTILICRNPESLERAMEILFQSGYAYTANTSEPKNGTRQYGQNRTNQNNYQRNWKRNNYHRQSQQRNYDHRPNNQQNGQNFQRQDNYNQRPNDQQNGRNFQRQENYNQRSNGQQNGRNFQRQDGYNPFRNQERQNVQRNNHLPLPEPMDINNLESSITKDENFQFSASGNFHI